MTTSSTAALVDLDGSVPPPGPSRRPRWRGPQGVRRRTKLLAGAVCLAVLAAVGLGAAWLARRHTPSSSGSAPAVTTSAQKVTVTTGAMKQTVSASGTFEPADDSDLTFDVSGTVDAVDVSVGEKVTKGQTLATVESTALADQVASDHAALTSDQDRLTTDQDDSAATSTIDSDESQVTSAESQLSTAKSDLADATLTATFSGTVASVDLAVGDVVSGAGSSTAGSVSSTSGSSTSGSASSGSGASDSSDSTEGITVISADTYTISTSVDDTEVSEVKVGDPVTITASGASSTLTGTVASVSLIASSTSSSGSESSSSAVATFPVVIDVSGAPSGVYPGASATASIVVKQLDHVVEIPTAAISYSSGQATVTEVVGGAHKTVGVSTGASLNGETQITSGLKAGDVIVEQVVKFKTPGGSSRSVFGGTGETGGFGTRTGTGSGFSGLGSGSGGPPSGFTGGTPSGGGFAGSGS